MENFSFFVPAEFEIEKGTSNDPSDPKRYKNMIVAGCASTNDIDVDEEILEPNGFELGVFKSSGLINYEHLSKKTPKALIGEPITAEIKDNKFFVKGKLWEKHPIARDLWDTVQIMKASGSTRKLGWSIEGVPLKKDPHNPKRIMKALITHIALTFSPKNPSTFADICKGMSVPKEALDYDIPQEVEYLYKGVFGQNEYILNKDFTIVKKAMSAGSETGQSLIGQDTNGAALKKESLDDDLKILTVPIEGVNWVGDNWETFKEDTKKVFQRAFSSVLEKGGEK